MKRRTLDLLAIGVGLALTIGLLIAGSLLAWGANFTTTNVHNQLAEQQIYFPALGSTALDNPAISPYLNRYAGQQLLTGSQAEAYADHFIAVHLGEIGGGKTYAQLSAQSMADPTNAALKAQVQLLFQGSTLRGLLLNAYAFSVFGELATWASWTCFALAVVMAILSLLGARHYAKTPPEAEFPAA